MGRRRGTSAFPVARIKKMMQADDDVGKIATVTPMLVAKALECMMELVLTEAASVAHERRSRTLTPLHLKHTVMSNDDFDFLRPVFSSVDGTLDDTPAPSASSTSPSSNTHLAHSPSSPAAPPRPRHRRTASSATTTDHHISAAAGLKRPRTPARGFDSDDAPPPARRGRPRQSTSSLPPLPALPTLSPGALPQGQSSQVASQPIAVPQSARVQQQLQALPPLQPMQSLTALHTPTAVPPASLQNDDEEDYDGDDADGDETEPALPEPSPPKADRVAVHALLS